MSNFKIIDSISAGLLQTWRDRRFLAPLTVVPILVMMVTAVLARRVLEIEDMLLAAVIQLPAEFVRAMLMVIYVRFLLLGDAPVFKKPNEDQERSRQITAGVVAMTTINFLFMGALQALRYVVDQVEQGSAEQSMAVPYFLLFIGLSGLVIWAFRYYWLYVPAALGWDIKGFYAQLPGLSSSLKIMLLMMGCFIMGGMAIIASEFFFSLITLGVGGEGNLILDLLRDLVLITISIWSYALVTAATAAAIQQMKGK